MTFKQRFTKQHKDSRSNPKNFSLDKIKKQHPISFSVDKIMDFSVGKIMEDRPKKRCDYFVLCDCNPSTTGIYVIELKSGKVEIKNITKQLQSGANFIDNELRGSDQFDFAPVLVAKSISSSSRSGQYTDSVCLRGKIRYIKHVKIGGPLEEIDPDTNGK